MTIATTGDDSEEGTNEKKLYVYYAVKEDASMVSGYTLSSLGNTDGAWVLADNQLDASEEDSTEPTLKKQGEDDKISLTNTKTTDFSITIDWKDNGNKYLTRPGSHKTGDKYNYWNATTQQYEVEKLTEERAQELNAQELEAFKVNLVLHASAGGTDLPVSGAELEIEQTGDIWTVKVSGLPTVDAAGNSVTYYLTQTKTDGISVNNIANDASAETEARYNPGGEYSQKVENPEEYAEINDKLYNGANITNTIGKEYYYTINYKWEDEGADSGDRPQPVIYLYRAAETANGSVDLEKLHPVQGYDSTEIPKNTVTDEENTVVIGKDGDAAKLPMYDSEGNRYYYYALVDIPNAGDYVSLNQNPEFYEEAVKNAAEKGGYLLNLGTLEIRRQANTSQTATKTFASVAIQDLQNIGDVSVTLMLQKQTQGEDDHTAWENVTVNGTTVTKDLSGFRGEETTVTDKEGVSVPKYDENGAEIQYRWVETSIRMGDQTVSAGDGAYFEENTVQTPKGENGTVDPLGPGVGDANTTVHFQVIYNDNGSVTNRLVGKTEVQVNKTWAENGWGSGKDLPLQQWLEGEGSAYKDAYILFHLIRSDGAQSAVSGDTSLADKNIIHSITIDDNQEVMEGDKVEDIKIDIGEDISKFWSNLPRYDENGSEYSYTVTETAYDAEGNKLPASPWEKTLTFEKSVGTDSENSDIYLQNQVNFHNYPAGDEVLTFEVQKVWLDDGDVACRQPVTVALYHKNTEGQWSKVDDREKITLNNANNWYQLFNITPINDDKEYANYLLVEETIGEDGAIDLLKTGSAGEEEADFTNADIATDFGKIKENSKKIAEDITAKGSYKTYFSETARSDLNSVIIGTTSSQSGLKHNYNVYLSNISNSGNYTIYNQRTGTVNFKITKNWLTGTSTSEEEAAVLAVNQSGKNVVWLKLDKIKNSETGAYSNTWTSEDGYANVLTGSDPDVSTGIPTEYLDKWKTTSEYQNGNYPKYDGLGKIYTYSVNEVAILLKYNGTISDEAAGSPELYTVTETSTDGQGRDVLSGLQVTATETDQADATLYHNYTVSATRTISYAESLGESDKYTYEVTNKRAQMLTLTANKVWQDDGSSASSRPDITFSIYRTSKYESAEALEAAFKAKLGADNTNPTKEQIKKAQVEFLGDEETELVTIGNETRFKWNTKNNDWYWNSSRFTQNERYDEKGNPYIYFLIETIPTDTDYSTRYVNAHIGSTVGAESIEAGNANTELFTPQTKNVSSTAEVFQPNYLDSTYSSILSAGFLIVTDGLHSTAVEDGQIVENSAEGASQDYCRYWSRTVINYKEATTNVNGRKIWKLPNGSSIDESYLPNVTFRIRRQSGQQNGSSNYSYVAASDFTQNVDSEDSKLYVTLGTKAGAPQTNANDSVGNVTFSGTNKYSYKITGLPKYDAYGQQYTYSVEENKLEEPYSKYFDRTGTSVSTQDYINTYTGNPTATLSFTKIWAVAGSDGTNTFTLDPRTGMIEVATGNTSITKQLPDSLTFEIKGYASTESDAKRDEVDSAAYIVTLQPNYFDEPGTYTVISSIRCIGGDQKDGNTKPTITVTTNSSETDATTANWTVSISNLKSIAPDGSAIIYEVQETPVPNGYQLTASDNDNMTLTPDASSGNVSYSGAEFTNTYSGKKFDDNGNGSYTYVQAEKIWENDGNDSWGRRPERINLYLYRSIKGNNHDQNTDYEVGTVSLTSTNSWKATAGGTAQSPTLLVYAPDGTEFDYYLIEVGEQAPSYEHGTGSCVYENGVMKVTLTNKLSTGIIYFQKNWKTQLGSANPVDMTEEEFDRLLALGALPTITITVQYYSDSRWTNLLKDGNPVQTTFSPDPNDKAKYTAYKNLFTNKNKISYTVPLYKEGTNVAGQDGVNYQEYRIKETVQYGNSASVDYYSTATDATAGIHATGDGNSTIADHTAVLTNTIPVQQVEIIKEWQDNQNQDGQRPDNLTITLKKNASADATTTVTASPVIATTTDTTLTDEQKSSGNYYSTGVILIPAEFSEEAPTGFEVNSMSVTEADVTEKGYTATSDSPVKDSGSYGDVNVTTFTFTNVYAPKLFHISATKAWNDEDNRYGLRNTDDSIALTLWYSLDNGSTWTTILTAGEEQKEYYHIGGTNYLYYEGGAVCTTTDGNGVLTSTNSGPTVTWANLPAKALVDGASVEVLYKITEDDGNKAYTGSADSGVFEGTIKYNDSAVQSFTITNSLNTTSLMIQKEWKEEGTDGASYRPDSISFQVEYRVGDSGTWTNLPGLTDGIVTIAKPADASGAWKRELTGLPLCDKNGTNYQYRVSEVSLTYTTASGTQSDAAKNGAFDDTEKTWTADMGRYLTKVTTTQKEDDSWTASAENSLIDRYNLFTIEVSKQWEDGENRFGLRPENNGVELSLQYSLDGGTTWSDITQSSLNWDNCYADNYNAYTTSEPTQTAVAAGNGKAATPARWENLPAKVLVNGVSTKVKYRVTEPGISSAYSSVIYTANTDGSPDTEVDREDGTEWQGTASEVQKFVIVNTMDTVSLTLSKTWAGEDAVTDGEQYRPQKAAFLIEYALEGEDSWEPLPAGSYRTEDDIITVGTDGLVTLTPDSWSMTIQGLAKVDTEGTAYQYRVSEASLTYQSVSLPVLRDLLPGNTDTAEGTFGSGENEKTWTGDAGRYLAKVTTTKNADSSWTASAKNTFIDRHNLFTIEVSKQWEDGENRFGLRPENNGVKLSLQYSLDGGTTWSDITKDSLNWDNCYADNYKAYTTSDPTQTAVAAGNGKTATPARWENLPAKVLVNGVSREVKYRITEPGISAAYSSEIYTAKADGSIDQKTDQKAGTAWKGTASEVQKFVIVNTLNTVSLTVSKEWTGEDGVKGAEALRPEKIEVRLEYALSGDADTWKTLPAGTYRTGSGSTVEVGEDGLLALTGKDGWETSLVGLRPYSEDGQTYSYRAQETKLIYQDGQSYTVQDADGGRYRVSGTTVQEKDGMFKSVLTNQLVDRYGARITKHALTLDGQVLQGAGYVLYRPAQMDYYTGQDADGNALWGIWNDAKILTTGEDGTVTVTGLPRGDYQFIEIAAAKGYRIDSTPVAFTIGDDNIGTLCEVHQADQKRSRGKHSSDRGHNSQAAVTDLQPVEPSRTGDTDDWRLYAGLAAGALLACGGYLLLRRRRRS